MRSRRDILTLLTVAPLLGCAGTPMAAAQGVAEEGFVAINGLEQWISVRGESADAPVLLFLHGGPGEAMSPFVSLFAPWEREFTVALWDQRGAGKTFGRDATGQGEVTLDQLADDDVELAEYLRLRFGKEKIVLVGQSWGSILGWSAIRSRPELFHAYVGTGRRRSWRSTPMRRAPRRRRFR